MKSTVKDQYFVIVKVSYSWKFWWELDMVFQLSEQKVGIWQILRWQVQKVSWKGYSYFNGNLILAEKSICAKFNISGYTVALACIRKLNNYDLCSDLSQQNKQQLTDYSVYKAYRDYRDMNSTMS